jgi:hypothetical protein
MNTNKAVTAMFTANPINGSCNPAVTSACQQTGYSGTNGCSSGARSNFRSVGSGWEWDCSGLFGGSTQAGCSTGVCRDFNVREIGQ